MKKCWLIVLLFSCQKKAVPVITGREAELPRKTEFIYPPKATVAPDVLCWVIACLQPDAVVAMVYLNPNSFQQKNGMISFPMFPRSRFDNEEALHVRA